MSDDTDTVIELLEQLRTELGHGSASPNDPFVRLKAEYEKAKKSAKSAADWERYQAAFASALPEFTKGVMAADSAFKSGDVFGGAAAIMDICATASNFIGALSAAGGPPGAVIGAIFSVISMILNAFKPATPSLKEEIEDLLRMLEAEGRIDELKTVQDDWQVFSGSLDAAKPDQVPAILNHINPVEGNCFHLIRYTNQWLKNPKNYSQDLWSEVLITQCQIYIGVMLTCTSLTQKAVSSSTGSTVPYRLDPAYADLVKAIDVFTLVISQCHLLQFEFLNEIRPQARNKGLVWHIGHYSSVYPRSPGGLYIQTAPKGANKTGYIKQLDGVMDAITVSSVTPKPEQARKPPLAAFHKSPRDPWPLGEAGIDLLNQEAHNHWYKVSGNNMTDWNKDIMEFEDRRNRPFDAQEQQRYAMAGNWELSENSGWHKVVERSDGNRAYDLCAIPGPAPGDVVLFTASGNRIDHTMAKAKAAGFDYRYGYTWNDMPAGYKVGRVRSVRNPAPPFRDEDADALKGVAQVIYGLCEVSAGKSDVVGPNTWKDGDHMELRAYYYHSDGHLIATKGQSFLPRWRNVRGITIDSRYLWIFRVAEIACATHSSIQACLNDGSGQPRWNTYTLPERTAIDPEHGKVYDGLLDLASCDDGTLTAAVGVWNGPLYTLTPRVNRKANTITIDYWRPYDEILKNPNGSSKAFRVYKTPIGGWPILDGLMGALEKACTTFSIKEESILGAATTEGKIKLPLPATADVEITFTSSNTDAILAPAPITIKKGDQESAAVIFKTLPRAKEEVATIAAMLSTSFSNFQPLKVTTTLKTVRVTFSVDRSVRGGDEATGVIALSNPAAEDIAVTFKIVGPADIFTTPDPIIIKKGSNSQTLSIKTRKTPNVEEAIVTATSVHSSEPFVLDARLRAVAPLRVRPH
jgi:hypothetical protein